MTSWPTSTEEFIRVWQGSPSVQAVEEHFHAPNRQAIHGRAWRLRMQGIPLKKMPNLRRTTTPERKAQLVALAKASRK